jgi:hypothetical protein
VALGSLLAPQEVLFPAFFWVGTVCIALQLAVAPLLAKSVAAATPALQLLGVSLAATLANLLVLEPRTTAVMKERAALEKMSNPIASGVYSQGKEAKMKELGAAFGKLHGGSSVANLVALCCAITYGWRHLVL